ncbi:hypothetical protein SAMIE_4000300 (plasmid) [Sphingobium amiense]|uniref:Porin n=3 Tax=Sphingomonadaceae TaxID=41297 RepID=A0A292GGB7_9SPHN|nr:hypothetical protein SCLO_6000290 [Sphingobium cloacae]BBA66298.1 hypothetical protein [Sphingobium amiense]BBE00502.1 hypothetical protein SAMIE_4000300 [Sphingobium amiense]
MDMKKGVSLALIGAGLGVLMAFPATAQEASAPQKVGPPAPAAADESPPNAGSAVASNPAGALARAVLGDGLESHKIMLLGWGEASAVTSTNDSKDVSPAAFFNTERGLNLNQLGVMLCSGRACPPFSFGPGAGVHNRVGPFPGPTPEHVTVDFNVTAIYGQDVQFLKLSGLDGDFHFDRNKDLKLGVTQAYADIYLPFLKGTSVMIGSFQTPLENAFNPPNWFATHTYGFQHGPAKHVGALAQTRVASGPAGHFSVDYGVVLGWNDWDNRNKNLDFIGGLRWRSADMRTWVDLEAIYGNGENDFGPAPGRGGSPYFALSSTGKYLGRLSSFLTVSHSLSPKFQVAMEASYGQQEAGDIAFVPWAITQGTVVRRQPGRAL